MSHDFKWIRSWSHQTIFFLCIQDVDEEQDLGHECLDKDVKTELKQRKTWHDLIPKHQTRPKHPTMVLFLLALRFPDQRIEWENCLPSWTLKYTTIHISSSWRLHQPGISGLVYGNLSETGINFTNLRRSMSQSYTIHNVHAKCCSRFLGHCAFLKK